MELLFFLTRTTQPHGYRNNSKMGYKVTTHQLHNRFMIVASWAVITSYQLNNSTIMIWNINYVKRKYLVWLCFTYLFFFYFMLQQLCLVLITPIYDIIFSSNLLYSACKYSISMHSKHSACPKYPWEAGTS